MKIKNLVVFLLFLVLSACKSNEYLTTSNDLVENNDSQESYQLDTEDHYPEYPKHTSYKTILYEVLPSDTLPSVARKYLASPQQIIELNNLKKPYYLKPGQLLKIPIPDVQEEISADNYSNTEKSSKNSREVLITPKK